MNRDTFSTLCDPFEVKLISIQNSNYLPPLHYAEVEKLGLKWLTLTTRFSAHFCTEGAKYLTGMSKIPKNLKKKLKNLNWRRTGAKKSKKPVAGVC